jgi:hypothetical protein
MVTAAMRDGFAKAARPRARQEDQRQSVSLPFENPTGCLTKTCGEGGASAIPLRAGLLRQRPPIVAAVLPTGGEKSLTDRFQKA